MFRSILKNWIACSIIFAAQTQFTAWAQEPVNNSCIACHSDYWQEMKDSIHSKQGITCNQCHGGDPAQSDQALAKAEGTGYIGVPEKQKIVEMCVKCHSDVEMMNPYGIRTDQFDRYKTSVHGKQLLGQGDTKVAACNDCHGYHDVLAVADPNSPVYPLNVPKTCNRCHGNEKLMADYKLPADMFEEYKKSVHGHALFEKKDLSVANCVSCHGSHGAVPPGVKEVGATCGKCHINEKKYFLESPHAKIPGTKNFSECISCHGNHHVEKPSPALYEKACIRCHDSTSAAMEHGRSMAIIVQKSGEELKAAENTVKQASIEGIFVEEEQAGLEEAKSNVIEIGPMQHTLSMEKLSGSYKEINQKLSDIEQSIEKKRQDLRWRKIALIPIWLFIFVMASALWIKYKELTGKGHKGE